MKAYFECIVDLPCSTLIYLSSVYSSCLIFCTISALDLCIIFVPIQVEAITDKFQPMYHSQMEVVQVTRPASMFQPILMTFWRQVKKHSRWRCRHLPHSPILFQCQLSDSLHLSTSWIPTISDCMKYQRVWFIQNGCLHKWKRESSLIPFLRLEKVADVWTQYRMTFHTEAIRQSISKVFWLQSWYQRTLFFSENDLLMAMIDCFSCG